MSKHRQAELDALTSQRFRKALEERNVRLITYRELIAQKGLEAMQRPGAVVETSDRPISQIGGLPW